MDGRMEKEIVEMCPSVPGDSIERRDMDMWYDNRRMHNNPQQSLQPVQYKYQNDGVANAGLDEMPTAAHWWKVVSPEVCINSPEENSANMNRAEGVCPSTGQYTETVNNIPQVSHEPPVKNITKPGPTRKAKTSKEQKDAIKRRQHPETWKVNIKKNARLRGEEYVGVGGKIVQAKVMGPPCECRMRCREKIDEESRQQLHSVFWKTCTWEQRKQYIALSVKESPKQRSRARNNVKCEQRRQVTFTYSLLIKGDFITVCKPMFLSTFSVSEKFVRLAMDKKRESPGGIIGPDQRGRHTPKSKKAEAVKDLVRQHINSFPADKGNNSKDRNGRKYLDASLSIAAMHKLYVQKCKNDGVPENDIVKESYYRDMFKNEFNLGFKTIQDKEKKSSQRSD